MILVHCVDQKSGRSASQTCETTFVTLRMAFDWSVVRMRMSGPPETVRLLSCSLQTPRPAIFRKSTICGSVRFRPY